MNILSISSYTEIGQDKGWPIKLFYLKPLLH